MCVSDEDRSPFAIHSCDTAAGPSGLAQIEASDSPVLSRSNAPLVNRALLTILVPIFTFVAVGLLGFVFPHVQQPLTDYRKALTDISKIMLVRNLANVVSCIVQTQGRG
jgi:hypothetical protein